jgi:PKD repeat protein
MHIEWAPYPDIPNHTGFKIYVTVNGTALPPCIAGVGATSAECPVDALPGDSVDVYMTATTSIAESAHTLTYSNIIPTAKFTTDKISGQCGVDTFFDTLGAHSGYEWDFGDGKSGAAASLYHTFDYSGSYKVLLTVTDTKGVFSASDQAYLNIDCW